MINKKIIQTININDWDIETDTGWVPINALHITIEYDVYKICTETNKVLRCADNHIIFDDKYNEKFVKDLSIGDIIKTRHGNERIKEIKKENVKETMYDFELCDESNHRYLTNDILSHNTYVMQKVAELLDVPFAICDATTLTEAGYVGDDVESVLVKLYQNAGQDVDKTQRGIIFIDEIDKIARKGDNPSITRDVSGEGVQQGLLKIIEGSVIGIPPHGGRKHPDQDLVYIDTKDILFICAGAFEGIEKKIGQRLNQQAVGYNASSQRRLNDSELLSKVTPQDLRSFGLIPEIIGRLPVITHTDQLDEQALIDILTKPEDSIIKQYTSLMELDGCELKFDDDALSYIAKEALKAKTGARALRYIMDKVMTDTMFEVPTSGQKAAIFSLDDVKKIFEADT